MLYSNKTPKSNDINKNSTIQQTKQVLVSWHGQDIFVIFTSYVYVQKDFLINWRPREGDIKLYKIAGF